MTSRKSVHDTQIAERFRRLNGAVLDIVAVMNRPQRDEVLIREAGIRFD